MIWPLGGSRRPLSIDLSTWHRLQQRLPCLARLDETDADRLRALIAEFLSTKTFSGAHGIEPDDDMRVTIAAQACLPVLRHGLTHYRDFVEIVVYPSAFAVQRKVTDEDGLVHEYEDVLAGEAMDGGPVVLSWDDVAGPQRDASVNVVIHEFAHKLDLADGVADGCPPMPAAQRSRWLQALNEAYDGFCDTLDAVEADIPPDLDPESEAADPYFSVLPLDLYAATDEAEFFAVAAEAFFVDPHRLRAAFGSLYRCFVEYFGQDPAAPG